MSRYRVTHRPSGSTQDKLDEVEATDIVVMDAGQTHFLKFVVVGEGGAQLDVNLLLPASTVARVEPV
jgi:hypothetical protein